MRVNFDRRLKLEFHGSQTTSDGGLLTYRKRDDALGPTELAGTIFQDIRTGKNGWHGMAGQFRQSVFGRLGGYEDANDADHLGVILPCGELSAAKPSEDRLCPPARSGILKRSFWQPV